jgi:predicted nucleic acid-binding protein
MAVFVDTGAWCAAAVPSDPDHIGALQFLRDEPEPLVTSDLVYVELLTLFRARGRMDRAREWVAEIEAGLAYIVRATPDDMRLASEVFFGFADKHWSFTDCVSRVLMQRLGVDRAFAFDDHFRQFGTVAVVP